jgi:hypothetical protein
MYQNEDVINGNKDLPLQVQIQWKWQTFIQRFESKFVEDLVEIRVESKECDVGHSQFHFVDEI